MAYDHFKTVNYTGGNNPNGDNYTWSHTANWVAVSQVGTTDEWKFAVSDNNTGNTRNATFTVTHWLSQASNEISASFQITQYADGGVIATTLATDATTVATDATTVATDATTVATDATTVATDATTAATDATTNATTADSIAFDDSSITVNSQGSSHIVGFTVDASTAQAHFNEGGQALNMFSYNGSTSGIAPGTIHWVDSSGNAISQPSWVQSVGAPSADVTGDGQITVTFDAYLAESPTVAPTTNATLPNGDTRNI